MAKTAKHLLAKVASFENLLAAYHKARRGKRFQPEVDGFTFRLERELLALRDELLEGSYQPGAYHNFTIYEPKKRLITAAPFRDRVVHHALVGVIEPLFEPGFVHDSYACRVGKGQHAAVDRFQRYARKYRHVLKCDIEKYFPSIDHDHLFARLGRRIGDRAVLDLFRRILASWRSLDDGVFRAAYFPGDGLFTPVDRPSGLPIGNLTSQFFANVYLDALDHFVKDELGVRGYVRYMDDFAIFGDNKARLHEIKATVAERLGAMRLRLHPHKAHIHATRAGVPFLGYVVFPYRRRIRGEGLRRFKRRLRTFQAGYAAGRVDFDHIHASIVSYLGHAKHADAERVMTLILDDAVFQRAA